MSKLYNQYLSGWKREYGPKPTSSQIKAAETMTREGTKASFAVAMGLRPQGVTQPTLVKVLGLPHRNVIKKLHDEKRIKIQQVGKRPKTVHLILK